MFERREHIVRVLEASELRFSSTLPFVGSLSFNMAFQIKGQGQCKVKKRQLFMTDCCGKVGRVER
jgi:hypothetical protein